ncbi:MAG: phosphatidate cytidylyltransferase [Deltaproteobacteria bacterium]|nr:phosphatidate cytidylyltransferase [Deltaproteobacteria bacterium]
MTSRRKRGRITKAPRPSAPQPIDGAGEAPATEPTSRVSNLALRFVTAGVGIPILLLLIFVIPQPGFFVVVAGAIGIGAAEAITMMLPRERDKLYVGVPIAVGLSTILYLARAPAAVAAAGVGLVVATLVLFLFRPGAMETTAKRLSFFLFAVAYPALLLTPVGLLHRRSDGPWWVLLVLALTWLADTGAYFAGRFLGRHKLMPAVSPAKTVEGAVGAVLAATVAALVVVGFFLPRVPLWQAAILGAVGGVLNILGDLSESMLKRSVGVKDSGTLLPGHGGMLDRVDALMFTGPAVWLFAELIVGT